MRARRAILGEILERIGRGAFGEVYRARDTRLDRVVALKWIAGSAPGTGEEVVREARLLARVRHPNVVTVHGADRIDGRVGIWMEYVEGEKITDAFPRDPEARRRLARKFSDALTYDVIFAPREEALFHGDPHAGNVFHVLGDQDAYRIALLDLASGEVKALPGYKGARNSNPQWAPDGKSLASGSADNTVRLWTVPGGQEGATFNVSEGNEKQPGRLLARILLGPDGTERGARGVAKVTFAPDGRALAARLTDGTLRVWRASTAKEVAASGAGQAPPP